ncbi:permease-like cell division protein FtsX [Bacillus carboniphilus]|uniref:Cell division protein FtsX n=1 Tax=Bacillus carboniphilus TaxID=86663 RepID=A0ABY9JT66_9BACI|nr:permease-like cell division protein FtsX [Bacillus carboniphilus]WLR41478.1 permease-like cell division protein FtsX [Bacillus carboniphilus]
MISTLLRHFQESIKSLGRNAWMTFASISAVTVTLLLVGTFLVVIFNLNHVASKVEEQVEVSVQIDPAADEEQIEQLKTELQEIDKVSSVVFSSKDEQLEQLQETMGDAFDFYEQNNPLKDVYIIKPKVPQDTSVIAKEAEGLENVSKVTYGEETVEKLFGFTDNARIVGSVLVIGLLFTAMFLISNTIKITIFARRHEIEIMKLVGATNWFIRWPFLMEGIFLGLLGSVIPVVLLLTSYDKVYQWLTNYTAGTFYEILPYNPFIFQVSGIIMLIGSIIGVWGSLMSIRKFLRI